MRTKKAVDEARSFTYDRFKDFEGRK